MGIRKFSLLLVHVLICCMSYSALADDAIDFYTKKQADLEISLAKAKDAMKITNAGGALSNENAAAFLNDMETYNTILDSYIALLGSVNDAVADNSFQSLVSQCDSLQPRLVEAAKIAVEKLKRLRSPDWKGIEGLPKSLLVDSYGIEKSLAQTLPGRCQAYRTKLVIEPTLDAIQHGDTHTSVAETVCEPYKANSAQYKQCMHVNGSDIQEPMGGGSMGRIEPDAKAVDTAPLDGGATKRIVVQPERIDYQELQIEFPPVETRSI